MVSEPQKELRFTRSRQAVVFCLLGAMLAGVGVTLAATGYYRDINPLLPHPGWSVLCLMISVGFFRLAWHLTTHAYLILTPLGLEIFPFFRPSRGMQLVMWQEIADAEVDRKWLTLHFNEDKTAGMHLSMWPVRRNLRELLAKAVLGRVSRSHT